MIFRKSTPRWWSRGTGTTRKCKRGILSRLQIFRAIICIRLMLFRRITTKSHAQPPSNTNQPPRLSSTRRPWPSPVSRLSFVSRLRGLRQGSERLRKELRKGYTSQNSSWKLSGTRWEAGKWRQRGGFRRWWRRRAGWKRSGGQGARRWRGGRRARGGPWRSS